MLCGKCRNMEHQGKSSAVAVETAVVVMTSISMDCEAIQVLLASWRHEEVCGILHWLVEVEEGREEEEEATAALPPLSMLGASAVLFFVVWLNKSKYRALSSLACQNSHFIFTSHKNCVTNS